MSHSLSAHSLAALEAHLLAEEMAPLTIQDGAVEEHAPLDDMALVLLAEQSAARQRHMAALKREFDHLASLSAEEASGWAQRRQERAACSLQSAWRRRVARHAFFRVVHLSIQQQRAEAAAIIQKAQRTRRRIVVEAAPPISQETVATLAKDIAARTLQMAEELRGAQEKQEAWRLAAKAAAASGTELSADEPSLPAWFAAPSWKQETEAARGSALVYQLREIARRGLDDGPVSSLPSQVHLLRSLEWAELRAKLQHTAVRRQVLRTHAASLHAQMLHPPQLPPASLLRERASSGDGLDLLTPHMGLKPAVQAAHRRALAHARLAVEAEEVAQDVDATNPESNITEASPVRAALELSASGYSVEGISSAELLWLASLESVQ